MLELLKVKLHGQRIGTLSRFGDVIRFQADPAYIANKDRATLTLQWVGEDEEKTRQILSASRDVRLVSANGVLPPYFEHLLPEGPNAARLARQRGCQVSDQFQLLAAAGHDLMGAVEVEPLPADEVNAELVSWHTSRGSEPVSVEIVEPPLDDGFALGGVQTKFSMVNDGRRYVLRRDGEAGSMIAKLPSTRHPDLVENECLCMQLMAETGLQVSPVEVRGIGELSLPVDVDFTHYLHVPRFDRDAHGQRLHMEEFAQIVGIRPAGKYARMEVFVRAMRLLARRSSRGISDVEECIRRLVAFALLGNTDAHLKNWAIVYADPQSFSLAPAYDVVCVTSFFGEDRNEYAVNRRIDELMRAWNSDFFVAVAKECGIPKPERARKWVRDVVKQAEDWPVIMKRLNAAPSLAKHITERVAVIRQSLLA